MLVGQQGLGIPPLPFVAGFDQHPPVGMPNLVHLPVGRPVVMHLPLALRAGEHPNIVRPIGFFPSPEEFMEAWEKHLDKPTGRKYWYNTITKEASDWTIHAGGLGGIIYVQS